MGKECNRTDLIAYANYEYGRLCFILVPLRGKINSGPRLLGVTFKKFDEHPHHFYMGVPRSPRPGLEGGQAGPDHW